MTHICVSKLIIIGSDNGLSPDRRQAIIWPNAGLLSIGALRTYFSENLIKIQQFSFKKMHVKMSSAKWRSSCLGLNVLSVKPVPYRGPLSPSTIWPNKHGCCREEIFHSAIYFNLLFLARLFKLLYQTTASSQHRPPRKSEKYDNIMIISFVDHFSYRPEPCLQMFSYPAVPCHQQQQRWGQQNNSTLRVQISHWLFESRETRRKPFGTVFQTHFISL